jgi:hypothetical protein
MEVKSIIVCSPCQVIGLSIAYRSIGCLFSIKTLKAVHKGINGAKSSKYLFFVYIVIHNSNVDGTIPINA